MAKALSVDLRRRVVGAIEGGASCRQPATRFGVSALSAIRWHALARKADDPAPRRQGGDRRSARIEAHAPLILGGDRGQVRHTSDTTVSDVWADIAYRSQANEAWLKRQSRVSRIHRRKPRGKPMPEPTGMLPATDCCRSRSGTMAGARRDLSACGSVKQPLWQTRAAFAAYRAQGLTMFARLARLFVIKTPLEAAAVIYALALGAVERGSAYLTQYPGVMGKLLFLACTGAVFMAGAKIFDCIGHEKRVRSELMNG